MKEVATNRVHAEVDCASFVSYMIGEQNAENWHSWAWKDGNITFGEFREI